MEKPERECAQLKRSPNENFADKPLSKKKFSYEIKHMTNSPYKISIKKNNFNINNASEQSKLPSQNPDHLSPSLNFIRDDLYDPVINTESLVLNSESYNNTRETSAEHINKTARRLSGYTFKTPPRFASNPKALYNQTRTIFRNQISNHIITGSAFNKLGPTTNKPNPNTNQTNKYYHNHLYQKARNTYTTTQFQLKRNFVHSPPHPAPKPLPNPNIRVTSLNPSSTPLTSLTKNFTHKNSRNLLCESNETIRDSGFHTTMYKTGFRVTDTNFYSNASQYEDGKNWESDLIGRGELIEWGVGDDDTRLSGDSFGGMSLDSEEWGEGSVVGSLMGGRKNRGGSMRGGGGKGSCAKKAKRKEVFDKYEKRYADLT